MSDLKCILLVEDDPFDAELIMTALAANHFANEVVVMRDGKEALDYLYCGDEFSSRTNRLPAVVLLDLKLPQVSGLDVLRHTER